MKKKIHFFLNIKPFALMLLFGLLFVSNLINAQVTTVFSDDFNRAVVSPGGTPSMTYTLTPSATGVIATTSQGVNDFAGNPDYRVKISGGTTAGTELVMGTMTGVSGYNAVLQSNSQLLTWSFNIKHNRSTTTMSGFDTTPAYQYGVGAILACDKLSPLDPAAKGYAVVMGGVGTKNTYDLVSFQNGMGATANLTTIIQGITLVSIREVVSVNVTYNKTTNKWNMFQRDETAATTAAPFPNPYGLSAPGSGVTGIGEVTDVAGFVGVSLPYFGTIFNHSTTAVNFYFDNYKVTLGQLGTTNFYVASGSDCSDKNNWWSNPDGATGTHPANFTTDGQIFNIFNTGTTIGSDWTVSGGGSKVVLGDGTVSNSLVVSATAFLSGTVKLNANATLRISHLTVFPTFESGGVDPSSTVIFDGVDAQSVPASVYGNLSILTQGLLGAKAAGNISVAGNLNIDANSILLMDTYKLGSINTLSGTGILKTKYAFSTALPSGITWPYSVYYNYTSTNTTQTISQGSFVNLDTTGGPRNFPNDITISGAFVPGAGVMTALNRITFNGTGAQSLEANFPPATALIIANTSTAGVSLSASEVIPDITNLELSGNLNADYDENFGTISLLDNSILTLGATPHALVFTNSSTSNPGPADFWIAGKTLTVKGWTGTPGGSGTNGKLFVGLDANGLTATQLSQITFEGYSGALMLSTGEVVPASLGIKNQELVDFKYYPNPVADKITLSNSKEISEVTIFNSIGQKVYETSPNSTSLQIDLSTLNASTYFVQVVSEGKKATVKVVKN
ncbi:T9SS type A sorting domain-containing protein [Flavobacterium sp. N1994]|uniref:T9SS type A sorting domain-containing protein n=1 Tax=Flavobacterium sp. N1994 TaxID=2986827 RepID=UPI0022227C87|nr:T9SS type A sorting domain-containing protein [Flavobacterium sp. N1994]